VLAEYEPKIKSRTTCLHQQVLGFTMGQDIPTSLDQFDKLVIAYQKSAPGKRVEDDTKIGVVLNALARSSLEAAQKLASHLVLEESKTATYLDMRQEIERILGLQKYLAGGDGAKAIQAIGDGTKGKGKKGGKAKKGKFTGKDGGKLNLSLSFSGVECWYCGRKGHKQADCRDQATGKPKGLGIKAKAKAGPKCEYCGLSGHSQEQCRKKKADLSQPEDSGNKRKRLDALEAAVSSLGDAVKGLSLGSLSLSAVEVAVSAVQDNIKQVRVGVDSGAEVTVWPSSLSKDIPIVPGTASGVKYWAPGDTKEPSIIDEGEKVLRLGVQRGEKLLRVRSCNVRKPLLSVADLNDRGWDVHFMARTGAWAQHADEDEVVTFQRVGGRFEFAAEVLGDGSFQGPGQARL